MADLPIRQCEQEILNKFSQSRVLVIAGETGCGKTTQVPQILLRQLSPAESIAVCQPR